MEESAPQIVTSNLENRKLRPNRVYFDNIGAIRASFVSILVISFFPALIRLGATLIELLYPLRPGGMFLVFFAGAIAFSWQLAASASLVVKFLRGERGNHRHHISFGFTALPKVLLSHSILILSLFFLFPASGEGGDFPAFIQSMLLIIVSVGFFLSWAPAFVAGEFFTKPVPPVDEDLEDFESIKLNFLKPRFFSGMGVLDLGVERSFYFCVNNFGLTVTLLLLGSCVKVIPAAIGVILFGSSFSYGAVVTECFLSSLGIGIVMVALGLTFVGALPKEARVELELLEDSVLSIPVNEIEKSRLLKRIVKFLVALLAVLATLFLVRTVKTEQSFPNTLLPQAYGIERTQSNVTLRFELDDKVNAYRWLDAERFRLQIPKTKEEVKAAVEKNDLPGGEPKADSLAPKKGGVLEALQNKLAETPKESSTGVVNETTQEVDSKFSLIVPKEVLFYSEKGELLDEKFFKPYYGKIRVTLVFDFNSKAHTNGEQSFNLESSINPSPEEQKLVYLLIDQTFQELGKFSFAEVVKEQ